MSLTQLCPESDLDFYLEVPQGLEDLAAREASQLLSGVKKRAFLPGKGNFASRLYFTSCGGAASFDALRIPLAVFADMQFAIPRPKALLGDQNFSRLLAHLRRVKRFSGCQNFSVTAAGRSTTVVRRLVSELEKGLSIPEAQGDGQLRIVLRRSTLIDGWEVAGRLTPTPLSVRPWRTERYPGALNPCLAAAAVFLLNPSERDCMLELCCGTATFLIERAIFGEAIRLCGVDVSRRALQIAQSHAVRAGVPERLELAESSVEDFRPSEDGVFTHCFTNLPWGERHGTREGNRVLYEAVLRRAIRCLIQDGELLVLTQDHSTLSQLLTTFTGTLELRSERKVTQGGFRPTLFHLVKK